MAITNTKPVKLCVGIDRGQNTTIAVDLDPTTGKRIEYYDSSLIARYDPQAYKNIAAGAQLDDEANEQAMAPRLPFQGAQLLTTTYKGFDYILGAEAIYGEGATTDIGNRNRYHEERHLIAMLVFSAILLEKKHPKTRYAVIQLVTGMPFETYSQEKAELVKKLLNGTHMITVCGESFTLTFEIEDIMMEGAGAARFAGRTDTQEYILLDTGSYNSAGFRVVKNKLIATQAGMTEVGVNEIKKRVNILVAKTYGRSLKERELDALLYAYAALIKEYGKPVERVDLDRVEFGTGQKEQNLRKKVEKVAEAIQATFPKLSGMKNKRRTSIDKFDLYEYLRIAIAAVGEDLRSFFSQLFDDKQGQVGQDVISVLYVGGGPYYLNYEIEKLFGEITVPDEPEYANGRGYAMRAASIERKRRQAGAA